MKTGLQQSTSLRQELKINPRLYQAMDLLYMPLLDLQQHLKQELLNNPFLDLVEPDDDENDEERGRAAAGVGCRRRRRRGRAGVHQGRYDRLGGDPPRRIRSPAVRRQRPRTASTTNRSPSIVAASPTTSWNSSRFSTSPRANRCWPRNSSATSRRRLPLVHPGRGPRERERGHRRRRRAGGRVARRAAALQPRGSGGDARDHPGPRSGRSGRARPPRVPAPAAARPGHRARGPVPAGRRGVRRSHRASMAGTRPPLRTDRAGGAGRGGRDRETRSQAGPPVQHVRRELHHSRPDRGQDRRRLPCLAERRQSAAPAPQPDLSGHRARQEQVPGREQGLHRQQAQLCHLDDPGHRAAATDDAEGDELHRRPATRILREGRAVPEAADAPRSGRSHQHARVHDQPRHEREVRADAARRPSAQVLLLVRAHHHGGRGRLGARHPAPRSRS